MYTISLSIKNLKVIEMAQRWLVRFEVDRPVFFSLLHRGWVIVAAPITLLLIASHLSPELQGYFYTFGSLIALQSFVELGFYMVITQFASHEWAHLYLDSSGRIQGTAEAGARLLSLVRLIGKWYSVGSILFSIGVGIAGVIFFSSKTQVPVYWKGPWIVLVIVTGVQLWLTPIFAFLEGCSQVASINLFRFFQALCSNLILWILLILNQGLWIAPAAAGASALCGLFLLYKKYRVFFLSFFNFPHMAGIRWKDEIWPMQWRIAVSGLVNYFAFSLFNPVIFHYHGPAMAGQMGMTWQACFALATLALAWVQTKVPAFGMLIAKRDYASLDRLFLKTSFTSLAVMVFLAFFFWLVIYFMNHWHYSLAARFLPPLPTGLLLVAICLMQVSQCESAYLRAHKREPLMVLAVVSSLLIGSLVWFLGSRSGPLGAILGYLAVVVVIIVPYETWLWFRYRRLWHA